MDSYVYRSHDIVIVRAILAGPPAVDRAGDITFRLARASDLGRLDTLDGYGRGSVQRRYVQEDNDWLFVACHGDRIVATRRYSTKVRDYRVSRIVELGPGQIWSADVFALPEYRSRGVGRHLAVFADRMLASQGYTELVGAIAAANEASLRLSIGKGTELVAFVSYRRFFRYERVRLSKASLRRLRMKLMMSRLSRQAP